MKKLNVVFAIVTALAVIGCATGGGGGSKGGSDAKPYIVDLGTLKTLAMEDPDGLPDYSPTGGTTKNVKPFKRAWDITLMSFDAPIDVSAYTRATITAKYYSPAGDEIKQGDSNCLVFLVNDVKGKLFENDNGPGPNTPLKEFNVGGFSGAVSKDRGVRFRNDSPIGGIVFQNNTANVGFIEVTGIIFHNGDYESEPAE